MSTECSEATIVKEEYEILEYDSDLKETLATEDTFNEPRSKCGEVFLGHRGGDFIFVCVQCQKTFANLPCFGEHIRDEHPLFEIETILPVTVDAEMPPPKLESSDQYSSDFRLHGGEPSEEITKIERNSSVPDDHSEGSQSETSKENSKPFSCNSCDKIFFEYESYRRHYTSEHSDMIDIDDFGNPSEQTSLPSEMCKYCLQTFNDPPSYQNHMENAHPNKLYSCPFCPKTFKLRLQRTCHVNSHEGKKPHKCPHCPSAFTRRGGLNEHVKSIHINIDLQFTCRFCDKKFKRKSDLKRHEAIHTAERTETVRCNECEMKFRNKSQLRNHMRKHYKCSHCDKAFISSKLLEEHLLMLINEKNWTCKYCSKTFDDLETYHSHVENDHPNQLYICPHCPKTYARRHERNFHVDTHEGRKPHKCPHCPSTFTRRGNLNDHIRYIHRTVSLEFTCRFCDKEFKRKFQLKSHEKMHTREETEAFHSSTLLEEHLPTHRNEPTESSSEMCKYCSKTFDDSVTYQSHVENAHPNNLFICPHCPKSFARWSDRNFHVDTHEGRKPHKYPHCPSAFATRSTLMNHDRYIHKTISLEFTCRFCDRKFKRKPDLKRHEKLHTGEATVGCRECDMKFKDYRQLRSHMRKHDMTQKNYKCSHCDKAFLCSTFLEEHVLMHSNERPFSADTEEHYTSKRQESFTECS